MKRPCQGYCGGYVSIDKARTVNGERFCPDCHSEYKRREYYG